MSLLDQYLNLNHRTFFKELPLHDLANEISKNISEMKVDGCEVYLYHSDPIKFALSFLALLDQGAAPICLSSSKIIYEDSASFFDGVWIQKSLKKSSYKNPSYSVLTSGTTGIPKRCDFFIENAKAQAMAHAKAFEIKKGDEILQTLPTYHSYGIIAFILAPIVTEASVNFCPGLIGIRPLAKNKSDVDMILHTSPAQARFILNDKMNDVGSLKKITIGGGALSFKEIKALAEKFSGCDIFVSYGLTEVGPRVSTGKFSKDLTFSDEEYWIGSPIKNVELKLIDGDHLAVKSPYMKMNLFSNELVEGEWYPTRDHVKLVDDHILFLSRNSDLLKFGGVTIYPKDIEDQVRKWDLVSDAIIIKKFDKIYEDVPYLFIEGSIKEEDAIVRLEKELSQALFIKKIIVLEKFPRQSLDKVDRKKLQDLIDG